MRKIAIGLSALLLIAATSKPGVAQDGSAVVVPQHPCIWYEAVEFPGCVNYGSLSEEQARTARGHPQFIEPQAATTSQAQAPSATPVGPAHAARIVPSSRQ
jgi:hypothetical protein